MKKLLSIFGAFGVTASSGISIVACNKPNHENNVIVLSDFVNEHKSVWLNDLLNQPFWYPSSGKYLSPEIAKSWLNDQLVPYFRELFRNEGYVDLFYNIDFSIKNLNDLDYNYWRVQPILELSSKDNKISIGNAEIKLLWNSKQNYPTSPNIIQPTDRLYKGFLQVVQNWDTANDTQKIKKLIAELLNNEGFIISVDKSDDLISDLIVDPTQLEIKYSLLYWNQKEGSLTDLDIILKDNNSDI